MKEFFKIVFKGIFVGIANIIPGVSGGTIAVVLGIFDKLIDAVNNFIKEPKRHLPFLIPLLIGALIGIGGFSKLIKFCLENFALPTNLFFVGLVVGSIPLIYKNASSKGTKLINYIIAVIGFLIVAGISFIKPNETVGSFQVSPLSLFGVCIGGIVASSAMVIPGISGSFVMVLIGLYNTVLTSISDFLSIVKDSVLMIGNKGIGVALTNIFTSDCFYILVAVGIGVIIGIILISKVIEILLKKAYTMTYFAILGLMFGSIFSIFADASIYASGTDVLCIIIGVLVFIAGFFISLKLSD